MSEPSFGAPPPGVAGGGGPSGPRASFGTRFIATLIDAILVGVVNGILFGLAGRAGQGLGTLVSIAYAVYFHGSPSGQTVGKHIMNIRVIDFSTGGSIDYGKAFIRWLCGILSAIPCLLGYFWMLWDPEKQTWHDKLAGTVVVPTSAYPVEAWPG